MTYPRSQKSSGRPGTSILLKNQSFSPCSCHLLWHHCDHSESPLVTQLPRPQAGGHALSLVTEAGWGHPPPFSGHASLPGLSHRRGLWPFCFCVGSAVSWPSEGYGPTVISSFCHNSWSSSLSPPVHTGGSGTFRA